MHGMPPKKSRKSAAKTFRTLRRAAPLNVYARHAEFPQAPALVSDHLDFLRRGAPSACRISPTNMATAARATTPASRTTGRRSTPSRWCRATASMPKLPPVDVDIVRPQLFRAARHRADGQPDRGLARRRQAARASGAARRACPTRSASPAAPPSRRSPRSRPTCSGCSSIASPRTTTPSASTWCAAPMPPACMC